MFVFSKAYLKKTPSKIVCIFQSWLDFEKIWVVSWMAWVFGPAKPKIFTFFLFLFAIRL